MNDPDVNHKAKIYLWFRRIVGGLFIIWLTIYLLAWSLSPMLIRWQVNSALEPLQLHLSDDSTIRINPFLLRLSLTDIQLTDAQSLDVLASVGTAIVDLDAIDLFRQTLRFEQLDLAEMTLDMRRTADKIEIAGWQVDSQAQPSSINESEVKKIDSAGDVESKTAVDSQAKDLSAEDQSTELDTMADDEAAWQVKTEHFNLDGLTLNIDNLGALHQIAIGRLQVNTLALSGAEQKLALRADLLLDNAPISIVADFFHRDGEGKISTSLNIERLNLQKLNYLVTPWLSHLAGYFSSNLEVAIQFDTKSFSAQLPALAINFNELKLGNTEVDIDLQSFSTNFQDLSFNARGNSQPQINARFSMASQRAAVTLAGSNDAILLFENYRLNDGEFTWTAGPLPVVAITNIALQHLKFSQPEIATHTEQSLSNNKPIITIDKLDINDLTFKEQHLSLDSLTLASLIAAISLDKNQQLTGLVLPTISGSNNTKHSDASDSVNIDKPLVESGASDDLTPNLTFSLGQLSIVDDSRFSFSDHSVTPAFTQTIELQSIRVESIDNRHPQRATTFTSQLKTDAYASAAFTGSIQLFNQKMNLQLNASVNEFSLPAISPYLADAMGFEMLNGQFDNKTHLTIIDNIIKGEAELTMRGMELTSIDPGQGNTLKDQSAMPLNSALGLLMDDKGNLELTLPLSGDISQPEFGISSFVAIVTKKAVMSAAQNYLMETFVPYANVLSVVMVAGEYMLKVSFEDLPYQPTVTTIQVQHEAFINQFIQLLKDKPETQVKVCAFATPADLPEQSLALNDPLYKQQLLEISRLRGEAFKAWVVEKGAIASSRLLLCQPQIDNKAKSKPRITFEA